MASSDQYQQQNYWKTPDLSLIGGELFCHKVKRGNEVDGCIEYDNINFPTTASVIRSKLKEAGLDTSKLPDKCFIYTVKSNGKYFLKITKPIR